ncbi:hypothetical protein [Psychrobacter sp. I-STPA10]|uniref:hypothetical protein n=1 Tax=Psychrobacter sp. I-STPA10 TaxID=2585769 RepID=UPI001E474606|nr:hypothetical protein [Psychrobacter sp. I-STPA10]
MDDNIRCILDSYANQYHCLRALPVNTFMHWFYDAKSQNQNKDVNVASVASVISDYMQKNYATACDKPLLQLLLQPQVAQQLHQIVRLWLPASHNQMFSEIQALIGVDISACSHDAFIKRLNYVLDLDPAYAYVQDKLYQAHGIDSETSGEICQNVDSYLQDTQKYLKLRNILDGYGLQPLSCYRFMQWWQLDNEVSSEQYIQLMSRGAFLQPQDFSGYRTLETYIRDYYEVDDDDMDEDVVNELDFSSYESALITLIKKHYLINHRLLFNQISHVIGYEVPCTKYADFLDSIEFFSNLSPVHDLVQHQLYFPPYNLPARLSKQLIQDVMDSGMY